MSGKQGAREDGLREFHLGQGEIAAGNLEEAIPHYLAALDLFDGDADLSLERAVTAGQLAITYKGLTQMPQGTILAVRSRCSRNIRKMRTP